MPQLMDQDKDKSQQQEQQQQQQQQQALEQQQQNQQAQQEKGAGVQAVQKLLASNARPEPKEIAKILWQYPEEKSQIIAICQQSVGGNQFVQQVVKEYEGWNVDLKGQRLAWGDSSTESKDFFVAGAKEQGARWQKGDFSGSAGKEGLKWQKGDSWSGQIGKDGLHTEIITGDQQKVVVDGNYKDKEATLKADYVFGDSTLGIGAHGKDLEQLGADIHGQTKLGEGTLSGKVGLDKNGQDLTSSAGIDYKGKDFSAGASAAFTNPDKYQAGLQGKVALDKDASLAASAGFSKQGQDNTISGGLGYQSKEGSLAASGSFTNPDKYQAGLQGKVALDKDALLDASAGIRKEGEDTTLTGGLGYQSKGGSIKAGGSFTDANRWGLDLSGSKKLGEDTTGTFSLSHQQQGDKSTEKAALTLKDEKNTLGLSGSFTDKNNYQGKLEYAHQLDKNTEIKSRLEAGVQQGKSFSQLGLSGSHKSDDLVLQANLEALKNQEGIDLKAGGEATFTLLNEKLYGQAFTKLETVLDDPKFQVGGGITWTPKDKLAITLAGVVDQDGGFDARLQLDVFQKKIKNAKDLDANKKNVLVSIFAGYRQNMDGGFMNDRFGAGKFGSESGQAYVGVGFRF